MPGGCRATNFCKVGLVRELFNFPLPYDPGAFAFAERGTALFFDQRRIAPGPGEAVAFEALPVIGFGIEWFLRRHQDPRAGKVVPGPQVIGLTT